MILQLFHSYMIRNRMGDVSKIFVKQTTEKCYKIQYENGGIAWFEADVYDSRITVIEDLGVSSIEGMIQRPKIKKEEK